LVVTFFFLKLIPRRRKATLLFEKSKESLSVDAVHLYLYHHITIATYIIRKAHKWTDSGRQWCRFTADVLLYC